MQKEEILKMTIALKSIKWPISAIEKELKFSNGLIGKAAKGETELSEEKFEKLEKFFKLKCGLPEKKLVTKKMVVTDNGELKQEPSQEAINALKEVNDKINKDFGPGTIMRFGDKPDTNYKVVSTGSLLLDEALGIGGLPIGRIVEIFGWESSGKSTIALNVIANAQKQGLDCLLVDAENAFDPEYADILGVKVNELQYCQPSYGEQGLQVASSQITSGKIGVVVFDSVAAMVPKAELEGAHGDSKMGLHARMMSQACRMLVGAVAKHNVLCIFINQFRHKIGVMPHMNPEVTTGGNALQFYASIRMEVIRSTTVANSVMNGDLKEGNQTTVKVIKNKCAPPFRKATFDILYGKGIDAIGEIIDLAVEKEVILKQGSWFSYSGDKLGQGRETVRQLLEDNEGLRNEIYNKLKQ